MAAPQTPHLAFPVRLVGAAFAVVEQDSDADIAGCVEAVIRCPEGWLDHNPTLGLPELAFTVDDAARSREATIREGIARGEPRAVLLTDEQLDGLAATVTVEVQRGN
jgi:hypothetical protein